MNDLPVTFEEVADRMVKQAAGYVASHYKRYLVTAEDCAQEIYTWLYTPEGIKWVQKRLEHEPQQIFRIRWKLRSVAKRYAEKMKAEKVGYDVEDLHWYTSTQVQALLPLALDPDFTGTGSPDWETEKSRDSGPRAKKNPAELGDLTALVLDIRRALDALPEWVTLAVMFQESGMDLYDQAVGAIVNELGGPRDYVGKRKVMTNAEAQARTTQAY